MTLVRFGHMYPPITIEEVQEAFKKNCPKTVKAKQPAKATAKTPQ